MCFMDEPERLVPAAWGPTDSVYPVNIRVEAWDRVGLIRDITSLVAEEKVNIVSISSVDHKDNISTGHFNLYITLETQNLAHLSRILVRIEGIRGVISVNRTDSEVTLKAKPST